MKKIAIAIIGTGHLGAIHAKLIAQNHDIHFAGIYDTDLERAQTIAQSHGTHAFQTTDELLNNADAIIIAAPTSVHHPLAMKAINAKKTLLYRKTHHHNIRRSRRNNTCCPR
jgi:predicted dehydrogenase